MKLHAIEAGYCKIDGGAAFGVVPKSIWEKFYPADDNNLISLSTRCLLIEEGNRKILIDTGLGNKQSEKFYSFLYRFGDKALLKSLQDAGVSPGEITDLVLTHLHYDHCGDALKYNEDHSAVVPVFPNAKIWVSKAQWDWALNPNKREAASYYPENILPLKETGNLHLIEQETKLTGNITLKLFYGHTDGLIVPFIRYNNATLVYVNDFIASTGHIPLPYIPSFDIRPLVVLEEKERFLDEAFKNGYVLIFEHDYHHECCTLMKTEKGIRMKDVFSVTEIDSFI